MARSVKYSKKFTSNDGADFIVRFYYSGVFTIEDYRGEHELGEYRLKVSMNSKYNDIYVARFWDDYSKQYSNFWISELAHDLANHYYNSYFL